MLTNPSSDDTEKKFSFFAVVRMAPRCYGTNDYFYSSIFSSILEFFIRNYIKEKAVSPPIDDD